MKYQAVILQATSPAPTLPAPPTGLEAATLYGVLSLAVSGSIGIITMTGRAIYRWVVTQDQQQNKMNQSFVDASISRENRLIDINEKGFENVEKALDALVEQTKDGAKKIEAQVERGIFGQTPFYKEILQELRTIKDSEAASHRRLDDIVKMLEQLTRSN